MREILETEDLVKYYSSGNGVVKAVDHTSLKIRAGEFTAIVGRSGSGKSTLLHMLGGLDRPDSGKVYLEGKDIFSLKEEKLAVFRRRKIGFIFQSYNLIPSLNVWENIVLPIGLDGCRADQKYVRRIVEQIGMEDRLHALPSTLSGGQQQRVAIARALASENPIILADEPTGNLDEDTAREIIDIFKEAAREFQKCVIIVSHSNEVAKAADTVFRLTHGKLEHPRVCGEAMA